MAKLGIGVLVQTTGAVDGEVTPNVGARTEIELLKRARRRLEVGVWVLGRDTDGNDVTLGLRLALQRVGVRVNAVEVDLRTPCGGTPYS